QRLGGNRRRATLGQLVKVTANMAPAEGETHLARSGQHLISSIPVYLQHAAEAGKMGDRLCCFAIRRVDIGHAGRVRTSPRSIVSNISEELTGLGSAAARIQYGRGRFIGEQL